MIRRLFFVVAMQAAILIPGTLTYAEFDRCLDYSGFLHEVSFTRGLGHIRDVVPVGDFAYAASAGLKVLDISDPTHITELGSVSFGSHTEKLAVQGSYVYATNSWDGIVIVDVSDPTNPQVVGARDFDDHAKDIEVQGDYAYVTGGSTLIVLDVSDRQNPRVVTDFQPLYRGDGLAISGNYAIVCNGNLAVIDISNPRIPHKVGQLSGSGFNAKHVAASGLFAYVANQYRGMDIVSLANPAHPKTIASIPIEIECRDIEVDGNRVLYISTDSISVIDVSDPRNPALSGSFKFRGGVDHAAIQDHFFLAASTEGLHFINMANPSSPPPISTLLTPGSANAAYLANDMAYVANGYGLISVDVADPENPAVIGIVDTPGNSFDVTVIGDQAWVADYTAGVQVVDISDPTQPILTASMPVQSAAMNVTAKGRFVFVADLYYGLQVIDTVHTSHRRMAGSLELPGQARKVSVRGDVALVTCAYSGLNIIDISRPKWPRLISRIPSEAIFVEAVQIGTNVVVATWDGRLLIFDIQNPETPTITSETVVTPDIRSLIVSGDFAYIGGNRGMEVVDISDPSMPRRVNIAPMFNAEGLTAYKDLIYVCDSSGGFHLMPTQCAQDESPATNVNISIKSKSGDSVVNNRSRGILSVTVVSDSSFDATSIDHRSVRFGPMSTMEFHANQNGPLRHEQDMDGDGLLDLVFHFRIADLGFDCNERKVNLTGSTFNGEPIRGQALLDCLHHIKSMTGDESGPGRTGFAGVYPNPFNPRTEISFELKTASDVSLTVYDLSGRLVKTLIDEHRMAGLHRVAWNGRDDHNRMASAAVYLCRLRAGGMSEAKSITLLK